MTPFRGRKYNSLVRLPSSPSPESILSYMDDEIYLSDLLAPVLAKWKLVLVITLIGAAVGLVAGVSQPRCYQSTATIYVPQGSGVGGLKSSIALSLGASIGGNSTAYYTTLLQSETLFRKTISRLGLMQDRFFTRGRKLSMTRALRRIDELTDVKDNKNGGVEISARMATPTRAVRVVDCMLDIMAETVDRSSTRKVNFISRRLAETTEQLDSAQDRLLSFQKKSGVPVVEEEGKRVIDSLTVLDARLLTIDVDLAEIKSNLDNAGDLDALVDQEVRRRALEASREQVMKEREAALARLGTLPDVASTYLKLQREVTVLAKTFEVLTERYQLATIEEQGEGGDYQIVDRAQLPDEPVRRGAAIKTAVGGFAGFMLGAILVSAVALGRRSRRGPGSTRTLEG